MVYKSSYPTIPIPEVDIPTFLFDDRESKLSYDANAPLFVNGINNKSYSHNQLKTEAKRFGQGLLDKWSWKQGDVMCIFALNSAEYSIIAWGIHYALGVVSPANPGYNVNELVHQLKDSKSKAIITQPEMLSVALEAAAKVGIPKEKIILFTDNEQNGHLSYTSIQSDKLAPRTKGVKPEDTAFIAYSSGTTGLAKGVMLTHRNIVANTSQNAAVESRDLEAGKDVLLAVLPFFHIYGLTCSLHLSCFNGTKLIILPRFDMVKALENIQQHKVSYAHFVPPIILGLAKHPIVKKYDLSSLRMVNSGAAPLTKEIVMALKESTGIKCKQGYGLTETSPTTHSQEFKDWKRIGSIGKLFPNMEAKFMSEEGKELPTGETGELWLRGPNIMKGYLNNPEATKNALTDDNFFRTGDIGHVDADGHFYITDRLKELIKYKGFQVPPAELEGLILGHPKVNDVAVIGVYKQDIASEVPRAYVAVAPGVEQNEATAKEIEEYVKSKVIQYKWLRGGVEFIDAVPKSASGKILRRFLRDKAKADEAKKNAKL